MLILVINCGSSSLKYQLLNMDNESVVAEGICEKIGISGSFLKHKPTGMESIVITQDISDHLMAVKMVLNVLTDEKAGIIKSLGDIAAIGHRAVHGGEFFSDSVMITPDVIAKLNECSKMAPLHNPPNIMGIEACQKIFPNTPMVAVFDTAFHQTMPAHAFTYGISREMYEKYKFRKYGFHGTSHKYISLKVSEILDKPVNELKIISCHLGNGASVCAIDKGKSIDTSMGYSPLDGLIMGTRSGSIDPAVIFDLMEAEKMTVSEAKDFLNKKSGIFGLTGISSDFRDIEERMDLPEVQLAIEAFCYTVKRFIGSYIAAMNGVDVIAFTAGVGENDWIVRQNCLKDMDNLGIAIDIEKSKALKKGYDYADLTAPTSKTKVLAIHTNEELMIARDTKHIVFGN